MKTIQCLDCQEYFKGETKVEVQMAMLPHYKDAHIEIISNVNEEGKKKWMEEFGKRWKVAEGE